MYPEQAPMWAEIASYVQIKRPWAFTWDATVQSLTTITMMLIIACLNYIILFLSSKDKNGTSPSKSSTLAEIESKLM